MSRESSLARAAATFEWGWSADELERLVEAAGWTWREPSEGAVTCDFGSSAGAFVFRGEVTAVYQSLVEHDDADVLARRDAFYRAVTGMTRVLGPPPTRVPGPDPSVGWHLAAGVLDVVDRPGALDVWLRPEPRRAATPQISPLENPITSAALAAAAASLPVNTVMRIGQEIAIAQEPDRLTITVAGDRTVLGWPAAGKDYAEMAAGLVTRLPDQAGVTYQQI
ncbi:hypothetical protein FB565_001543 [Actinoplanes lutulentus]|uniref:DUF6301 family protein n=1 Tax=Actinoplanes lutulentus TaxID=1287878 RepID=UPI0011B94AD3|nr:DUF6301 family protein [Actinoplanes lutulentus]MBB2941839.1 hypothetical protein [Actinoplanes lutulentus]